MTIHNSVKNKLEQEIFKTLEVTLREIHDSEYCYETSVFKGLTKVIAITCADHGKFLMSPLEHGLPTGCPKCETKPKVKKTVQGKASFIEKMELKYKDQFDLTQINYLTQQSPITLTCKKHGPFTRTPKQLLYSYACPDCRIPYTPKSVGNLNRTDKGPTIVYYVYFPSIAKYKVGLVSINTGMEKRFKKSKYPEYNFIDSWLYSTGKAAETALSKLLEDNKDSIYKGKNLLTVGNTELLNQPIKD